MTSQGYALARAELLRTLVAHTGITTANGVGLDTLVDSALAGWDQRKIVEKTILICSGDSDTEDAASVSFVAGTGTITVSPAFSNQILAGTIYRIINISTVELDVINILARIGTNVDAAGTTTLFAWFAKIFAGLLGGQGLCYGGVVTAAVPGASFTIDSLKGLGAGKFHDATAPYRAFVLRTALGTSLAPQGEMAAITGYTTATGLFTPNAPAFTVDITVGDEVLILHPRIAEILNILTNLGPMDAAATADDLSNVTTTSAQAKLRLILLRMSGAGVFSADIQGAARTELDTMLAQLATYFKAAGATFNPTINGAARADVNDALAQLAAYFKAAGAALNPTINGAVQADVSSAFAALATYFVVAGATYSAAINPGAAAATTLRQSLVDLADMLAGATGIVTFPAASPPANGVSLAAVIRYIQEAIDAFSTLYETGGTFLADGTEQNVVIDNAPASVFIPMTVKIDLDNMAAGDTTVIKVYDRIKSGGGLQQVDYQSYAGADGGLSDGKKVIYVELKPNRYGFKVTLQQTGGVNCNYDWEYFYES